MKKYAVIVAGGSGQRMGSSTPKQFLEISGKPVIWYTLHAFLEAFDDLRIMLVLPEAYLSTGQELVDTLAGNSRIKLCTGGITRFDSVKNGLKQIPADSIVFVHDGVRCLVTKELIRRCYDTTVASGSAVPAIAPADSMRELTIAGHRVIDRSKIRMIQTPQTFRAAELQHAFEQDHNEAFSDEATVMESKGYTINLVEGENTNLKITLPSDLLFATQILESRKNKIARK